MSCNNEYFCTLSMIKVRSFLDGPDGCAIDPKASEPCSHVVEVSSLGAGRFRVLPQASCDQPLRFPRSSNPQSWRAKNDFRIVPIAEGGEVKRLQWDVEATGPLEAGMVDPSVSTVVEIVAREKKGSGSMLPSGRKIPPNDQELSFSCSIG
jgi:hypothetical protein